MLNPSEGECGVNLLCHYSGRFRVPAVRALALCLVLASSASACSVPVFRYALERWLPDPCQLFILRDDPAPDTDGPETADAKANESERQRKEATALLSRVESARFANILLTLADPRKKGSAEARELWEAQGSPELPHLFLKFSRRMPDKRAFFSAPMSDSILRDAIDSPKRREIARRILDGDSIVWVLLESGRDQADSAAESLLKEELARLEEKIVLPEGAEEGLQLYANSNAGPKLKVAFSVLTLSRSDEEERVLVEMLLAAEADLGDYDEPMAFPVFGRGRTLGALVGRGINSDNIEDTCAYLTSACSCLVKAENPGTDLLMAVDWDGMLGGSMLVDEAPPPLTGVPEAAAGEGADEVAPDASAPRSGTLARNVGAIAALGLVLVALATAVLVRRNSSREG